MLAFVISGFAQTRPIPGQAANWSLRDTLIRVGAKVDSDDSSVQRTRLDLQMLQALNRTKVEFRPQFSILSFSNPLFLAASLGGSFSINRRTAPSALDFENARFAMVEAEVRHARRRIDAQISATREFFALAEAQEASERTCAASKDATQEFGRVQALLTSQRITKLDVIHFEQQAAAVKGDCIEAKVQAIQAASALLRLTGEDRDSGEIRVATDDLPSLEVTQALAAPAVLADVAFESRQEFKEAAEQMQVLAQSAGSHKLRFDTFSAGYSYIKDGAAANASKQYLLGGNAGQLALGWSLSLRNTHENEIATAIAQTRFESLQRDLHELKCAVQYEIEENERQATLAEARLEVAREKARLATELYAATTQRVESGLQYPLDELAAKRDIERSLAESARLKLELQRNVSTILALSDPEKLDPSKVIARLTPDSSKAETNFEKANASDLSVAAPSTHAGSDTTVKGQLR
jgi:outer membrane protein TolC